MNKHLVFCLLLAGALCASAFVKKGSTGRSIQTNGSQSDVQAAIDAAPDNGTATVIIPPGTYDWGGVLNIKKAVSLAGNGEVVIRNQLTNGNMIQAESKKTGNIQIYNLSFKQISDNGAGRGFLMMLSRDPASTNTVIVHDCTFDQNAIYAWTILCNQNGFLFYNDSFKGSGRNGLGGMSLIWGMQNYELYNTPSTMGTADTTGLNNTYIEDCQFALGAGGNMDANSRSVWRHNTFQDAAVGSHGQETSQNGVRHWEFYGNTFLMTKDNPINLNAWVQIRGGTGVFTGNYLDEIPWGKSQFQLNVFSITRGANDGHGGTFCPVEYPAPRQTGWGWANNNANWGRVEGNPTLLEGSQSPGYFLPDGKGAILEPVYAWDDSGPGSKSPLYVDKQTYQPDDCGNAQTIETYLQKGRDYYVNSGAKPNWTPYPYPHPLRGGGQPSPTPSPTAQPTPTPQPTATPSPSATPYRMTIQIESASPITVNVQPPQ